MGEEGEVLKQNTILCFFLPLLSFIFENLLPQLYFSKKKKKNGYKKKKKESEGCLQSASGQDYRRNSTGDCKAGIPLLLSHHIK